MPTPPASRLLHGSALNARRCAAPASSICADVAIFAFGYDDGVGLPRELVKELPPVTWRSLRSEQPVKLEAHLGPKDVHGPFRISSTNALKRAHCGYSSVMHSRLTNSDEIGNRCSAPPKPHYLASALLNPHVVRAKQR